MNSNNKNADQEEGERRGRESWANGNGSVSARPESPLRLTMSLGNEAGGTGTVKEITSSDIISNHSTNDSDMIGLADGTAAAAAAAAVISTSDDADKNNNNRKRKEIVLGHSNSHQALGNCISLTDANNTTMPKKLKKIEDNINVGAPTTADTDTSPDIFSSTQPTMGRGSVCTVASAEPSSLPCQKKQKEAKGEKNTTIMHHFRHHEQHRHRHLHHHRRHHHVGHVSSVKKNISANDNTSTVLHHTQQRMLNPDIIHTTTTAMMTKRNEIMLRKEEDEEEGDIQDTAHPTKRWPITLAIVTPLLVVVMSTSFILVAPSTATSAQHLPQLLLLSLAILITLLPILGLVLLPPMPTTTSMTAAAASTSDPINNNNTPPTLREFLSHPEGFHMSFAPAFFGFFAYFGCLTALEEMTNGRIVPKPVTAVGVPATTLTTTTTASNTSETTTTTTTHAITTTSCCGLQSVSGASAGAMAAVMLAAGIQPRIAAQFASTFTWKMIADPPGWGGYVRGNNFEEVMRKFLLEAGTRNTTIGSCPLTATTDHNNDRANALAKPIQLEEALVPVSVSAFDLLRMKGMNLTRGCMAKAARCSAGFPGLFQPVAWRAERNEDVKASSLPDSLLIDGGITDHLGLNGLCETTTSTEKKTKRVINMMVGDFGFRGPRGLDTLPTGVNAEYLVSIAIIGTPLCGPWAMQNGPRAVESSRKAMASILDLPMERGTCDNHHVIRVDASKWLE